MLGVHRLARLLPSARAEAQRQWRERGGRSVPGGLPCISPADVAELAARLDRHDAKLADILDTMREAAEATGIREAAPRLRIVYDEQKDAG